jgi:hypothetical protein
MNTTIATGTHECKWGDNSTLVTTKAAHKCGVIHIETSGTKLRIDRLFLFYYQSVYMYEAFQTHPTLSRISALRPSCTGCGTRETCQLSNLGKCSPLCFVSPSSSGVGAAVSGSSAIRIDFRGNLFNSTCSLPLDLFSLRSWPEVCFLSSTEFIVEGASTH